MSAVSLGLRSSSSYGLLQQALQLQLQNERTRNGGFTALSIQSLQFEKNRRQYREKERLLSLQRICKIFGRRKGGMLLLVLFSAIVFCSLFGIVKDEASVGLATKLDFPNSSLNNSTNLIPPLLINTGLSSIQISPPSAIFTHHPCENYSFSPPPFDVKRTGPRPCPVCYVSVEQAIALMPPLPSSSPVLSKLSYINEDNLVVSNSTGGSNFGGHPTLKQRDESFNIKMEMMIHCGFVKGKRPGQGTGFDIEESDLIEMERCNQLVVASAIFGNYDEIQQPKSVSKITRRNACFYMFVDEETEAYLKNTTRPMSGARKLGPSGGACRVGLWRLVVVRNLPYSDARRNGKIPKLLLHRLFPNARYSLWIDAKLELVVDPYLLLERFLWREKAPFAISRHYRRFDVYEEAEANKAAGKYDNSSIDYQIDFYKKEGLTHYSLSKLPITSDVPEGCVIIREHTPITNLFTCLWFNEVDRFTSRDQLSFSTVRDKIMARVEWVPHMFWDCERRNFVVQQYHRDVLVQRQNQPPPPPVKRVVKIVSTRKIPIKKPVKRFKDKKPGQKRRRPRVSTARETGFVF